MQNQTFSERLKSLLNQKNMKASELSRITGLSESLISQYLSGKINPKNDKILLIANTLDTSILEILGIDEKTNQPDSHVPNISYAIEVLIKETWGQDGYNNLTEEQKEELAKILKYALLIKKHELDNK